MNLTRESFRAMIFYDFRSSNYWVTRRIAPTDYMEFMDAKEAAVAFQNAVKETPEDKLLAYLDIELIIRRAVVNGVVTKSQPCSQKKEIIINDGREYIISIPNVQSRRFYQRDIRTSYKGVKCGNAKSFVSNMAGEVNNNHKMKFSKTDTEYNMKSIRFLLLTITAMFIAIALLLIVLGNSVYGHYHSYRFFYESGKVGRYITPASICVFLGLALLIVSVFGFYGSLRKSTCMVNVYAFILLVVFIFKLVVVCLAFSMDADTLRSHLEIPVWDIADPEIRAEVDYLQRSLGCCGSKNYMDYMGMTFPSDMSTTTASKVIDDEVVSVVLPATCCVNAGEPYCTRMWASGCQDALVNIMMQNSIVIGVLGVSVMFINLLGIVFALLLACSIRKMKSEKALMAWKIKEQMILARQAEEIHKTEETDHVYIDHQATSAA